jgi:hypothetical protein
MNRNQIIKAFENNDLEYPKTQIERQSFLNTCWELIFDTEEKPYLGLIPHYNKVAEAYNKEAKSPIMVIINNQIQSKMATAKKAAAKKAAPKKAAAKKAAPKKTVVKKATKVNADNGEKPKTQKQIIVELAEKGHTIDEIAEISGIQKPNVSSTYSRLKLGKKAGKK